MEIQPDILFQQKLHRSSKILISVVMLIAVLVLAGWEFNIDVFKRLLSGKVSMNPMTAFSFLLIATAFLLFISKEETRGKAVLGSTLSSIVVMIGVLKIISIFSGFDAEIDRLLFSKKINEDIIGNLPNRMAPNTAAGFIFSGISLLFLKYETHRKRKLAQYFVLITALIALLSILGYIYQVEKFYGFLSYIPMAFHTAICFLFFSVAVLFVDSKNAIMREFTSVFSGSVMAKMLVPAAVIIPALLGLLRLYGNWSGIYNNEFGVAIYVLSIIVIFLAITWYNAFLLNKRDMQKKQTEDALLDSEEQIRAIFENAPDAIIVINNEGRIIKWNPEAEKLFGWKKEETVNRLLSETIIPAQFREAHQKGLQRYLSTGENSIIGKSVDIWAIRKDNTELDVSLRVSPMTLNNKLFFTGFVRDITERKKMETKLQSFNKELTQQVEDKTKELKESYESIRQLSNHLQNIREEERLHIAREIHDELGQLLTVLKMDVSWLNKKLATSSGDIKEKLSDLLILIDKTVTTVRRISSELRPTLLDDLGLVAAIEWHLEEFEKRSGISKELHVPASIKVPDSLKIGIFRIFQESLTNVARHSGANKVTVNLERENGQIVLKISDNGKGFDKNQATRKTLGVLGMKERTLQMGGSYHITGIPGKGTTVEVTIPLPELNTN